MLLACITWVLDSHVLPEPFLVREACLAEVLGHAGLSEHAEACQVEGQAGLSLLLSCLSSEQTAGCSAAPVCMTWRTPEQGVRV